MKINLFLAPITALLLISLGCSNKEAALVKSWKVGTFSGLFNDFSQAEFDSFKESGIDCIEIGAGLFRGKPDEECEKWVEDIRQRTASSGIEIWSVHLPFSRVYDIASLVDSDRVGMISECRRIMKLCSPLKPRQFVIHGGVEPVADSVRARRLSYSEESLKQLVAAAKEVNAQVALECLPRTCLGNTSDELLSMLNAVGSDLGVCFDSNHLLKEKPEEFVAKVGARITTLHISDYDGIDEKHWLPGTGIINWNAVVSELVKCGYKGPFMFEASRRRPAADGTITKRSLLPENCIQALNR